MRSTRSPNKTSMPLALKDLHATRRGYSPNWVHNCQNGKIGRLGRPSRVGNLGALVAPSLDSPPLVSPLIPCLGIWLAVTLEPSANLVPSESPASGRHGFAMWGHDAKIIKFGVIPTAGSLGQGKANGSQERRQDLGPKSKCTTRDWVRASRGHRDLGPPLDHTGG